MLVVYCQKRRKKALKKARRKNKNNKVGDSFSDSDVPREPIVIHQPADHNFTQNNDSTMMNNSNL